MDAMEALRAACIEPSEAAARIGVSVKDKLLKRAQTYGTSGAEAFDFTEAWEHVETLDATVRRDNDQRERLSGAHCSDGAR
jgi:hypothetical protein